jgi:hypothetical protein
VLWNSHGFNLTNQAATIEQYNSFWYARPEQRVYPIEGIFTLGKDDIQGAFINVLPFQQQEVCQVYTLPRYARLHMLTTHGHKRAVQWRSWLPPNIGHCPAEGCKPRTEKPDYLSTDYTDPVVTRFEPAKAYDSADEAERTILFCATYDNGKTDPKLLKRKSQLIEGNDCQELTSKTEQLFCAGGTAPGKPCKADADCGAGGACDACLVQWGERTEDEMFFLVGSYYVVPPKSAP